MQERIVELIVYLLTRLQQDRSHTDTIDLSREAHLKGYAETEVNLAFAWIFNHLRTPIPEKTDSEIDFDDELADLTDIEKLVISPEAYGFLLQLINLGVIRESDIEMFVERALAIGKDDINIDDLKSIVANILFGADSASSYNGYSLYDGDIPIQ